MTTRISEPMPPAKIVTPTGAQNVLPVSYTHLVKANVFLYLKSCAKQFDVIFSDAPYDLEGSEQVVKLVLERGLLRPSLP